MTLLESQVDRQLIAESVSEINETRQDADYTYFWVEKDGTLLSPFTKIPITSYMDTLNPPGPTELRAIRQYEHWIRNGGRGVAIWISPPNPYIFSKISISSLTSLDGHKVLENRHLVFDEGSSFCLKVANQLLEHSNKSRVAFTNTEDLRSSLIFLDTDFEKVVSLFENIAIHPRYWVQIKTGSDIQRAEELTILLQANRNGAQRLKGDFKDSCFKLTPNQVFTNLFYFERFFPCPKCKRPIPSGKGITKCPHCSAKKEEFGSSCD